MKGRHGTVLVVAALCLGLGVPPAGAQAGPSESPLAAHAAKKKHRKRKAIRCRKTQVPIKVRRRTVGCRSLRAALPTPRDGDTRLVLAQSVFDDGYGRLRDRRGRRAPSVKKLLRKAGPRTYGIVQRAIPDGLARLDRLGAGGPVVSRLARAAADRPRSCSDPGAQTPTLTDKYESNSGGEKVSATAALGRLGTFDLTVEGRGYRISVGITTDPCAGFDSPPCPTADGVVDATDSSKFKVSLTVAKGDTVLMSRDVDLTGHTRMHAEVGEDAKLQLIDIDDTQTANIELGGAHQDFGPVQLVYTGIHHARVAMPGESYVPDQSAVDIALTARGVTVGRSDLGAVGNNIAADLDKSFAELVKREIGEFKSLAKGWENPNACVQIDFSPGSRTLKLHKGQHGSVTVQATAKQGGGASPGHWTRTGQANATFTPDQADGTAPAFAYDVTNSGKDVVVTLGVRVTSKAGVGEATWEQETDDLPLYRGTLTGMQDVHAAGECGQKWHWDYSGRLAAGTTGDEPFAILDPALASNGFEGGLAGGRDETLTGTYDLPACHGLPGCSSPLSPKVGVATVSFDAEEGSPDVSISAETMPIDNGDCGTLQQPIGEATIPRSRIGDDTIVVDFDYSDSDMTLTGKMTLNRVN